MSKGLATWCAWHSGKHTLVDWLGRWCHFWITSLVKMEHACDVLVKKLAPGIDRLYGLGQPVVGWLQVSDSLELASPD